MNKKNVTIYDIARITGFSIATVNRVVNNSPKVKEQTRHKILEAIKKTNYKPNVFAKNLARNALKFGILINYNKKLHHFMDDVLAGIDAAREEILDTNVVYEFYFIEKSLQARSEEVIEKIKEMAMRGFNGILIATAVDLHGFQDEIASLRAKGVVIATRGSALTSTDMAFSVRQDAAITGRLAAELLWWFTESKNVAIFSAYENMGTHSQIIEHFINGQKGRPLNILKIYENLDDDSLAYENADRLLKEHPQVEGIYINSANSSSVCQRVIEKGLAGKIKIVASDAIPDVLQNIQNNH